MRLFAQCTLAFALSLAAVGCGASAQREGTIVTNSWAEQNVNAARLPGDHRPAAAAETRAAVFAGASNFESHSFSGSLSGTR